MPNYLRLLTPRTTVLFVCDVQECFRPSVYGFRELCTSISKMVRAAAVYPPFCSSLTADPPSLDGRVRRVDGGRTTIMFAVAAHHKRAIADV